MFKDALSLKRNKQVFSVVTQLHLRVSQTRDLDLKQHF